MSLQDTPRAGRLHIGLYGKRNAGKSSLINALTGQETALVSPVAGTTTDPVYKAMELHGFGPVVWIDTPGLDDEGELGALRVDRTRQAAEKTDVAVVAFAGPPEDEGEWIAAFRARNIPVAAVVTKADEQPDAPALCREIEARFGLVPLAVSARTGEGVAALREKIASLAPADFWERSITGPLAKAGDVVLLVMPQDIEAPKGRLILPQVQTIRELLDKKCTVVSCTADCMAATLGTLARPPQLVITDSQAFDAVAALTPVESRLTSFSILFAGYKGDIAAFRAGAKALDGLNDRSRVLICEACTHAPAGEDIGRVKIPALLRKRYGGGMTFDFVRGGDFPQDLTGYDLIIHCGACMFNRRYMMERIAAARRQGTPICNYGVVLAALNGILGRVCWPEE